MKKGRPPEGGFPEGRVMTRREQEHAFRDLCGSLSKKQSWKKEALLLELFARARGEDRAFALDYLAGRTGLFDLPDK